MVPGVWPAAMQSVSKVTWQGDRGQREGCPTGQVPCHSPCWPRQRLLLTFGRRGVLHFHLSCVLPRQLVLMVRGWFLLYVSH